MHSDMKILMVCLGNICRSPLAEGVMQHLIDEHKLNWQVDSAGTSGWHNGELPDRRSIEVADNHGIDITTQRSRKINRSDLNEFDLIIAMDASNYNNIISMTQNEDEKKKVKMLLNYSFPGENRQVPDPYYEGGFEKVYQMVYSACESILQEHGNSLQTR